MSASVRFFIIIIIATDCIVVRLKSMSNVVFTGWVALDHIQHCFLNSIQGTEPQQHVMILDTIAIIVHSSKIV